MPASALEDAMADLVLAIALLRSIEAEAPESAARREIRHRALDAISQSAQRVMALGYSREQLAPIVRQIGRQMREAAA